MARCVAEETPCQCNAAFLNSVVGRVTDVEQVNESSGNIEEADALLEPFSGRPHRVRSHNTRIDAPSVEEEVENGEDEEAASHQRSQHSEELLEVNVIVRTVGRR
jgi:hypothetical protein